MFFTAWKNCKKNCTLSRKRVNCFRDSLGLFINCRLYLQFDDFKVLHLKFNYPGSKENIFYDYI